MGTVCDVELQLADQQPLEDGDEGKAEGNETFEQGFLILIFQYYINEKLFILRIYVFIDEKILC